MVGNVAIFGPFLETKLFPVYSKFEIATIEAFDDTHTRLTFKFTKLRNCTSRSASWLNGELGQQVNVVIKPSAEPLPRPLGEQFSRPYVVDIAIGDVPRALVASIMSRCPFMPWDTKSEVYP